MKLVVLIFLTLWSAQLQAQVTLDEFLYSALEDPSIKTLQAQASYLTDKSVYRMTPVQKIELRTESNQLDRTRQDYGLRINPANPFEVKRTAHYFQTYQQLLQLDQQRTLKELLYNRTVAASTGGQTDD
jgi:SOS-response transcriptional repressor LexA